MNTLRWHEGDLCHKLRRHRRWTVETLARRAGLTPSIIRRLEQGVTREPERKTVEALALAFDMTPREFQDAVPSGEIACRPQPAASGREQARRRA